MSTLPNFELNDLLPISQAFIKVGANSYHAAATYIKQLPYGRNADKTNLLSVLTDNCGTCSTKHALLYQLAKENEQQDIVLMMGMFKMDAQYAPSIAQLLVKHSLPYLPEAHNYLLYNKQRVDCTHKHSKTSDFEAQLLEEQIIDETQILDYKVDYHKSYLSNWLQQQSYSTLTINDLWQIREECISLLSQ